EDPSQDRKKRAKRASPKDEQDPTDDDQDVQEPGAKKVSDGGAERDEPTKIRNKRKKGQAGRTDGELGDGRGAASLQSGKKRVRQGEAVTPQEGEPSPENKNVKLVDPTKIRSGIRKVFKKARQNKRFKYKYDAGGKSAKTTLRVNNKTVTGTTTENMH